MAYLTVKDVNNLISDYKTYFDLDGNEIDITSDDISAYSVVESVEYVGDGMFNIYVDTYMTYDSNDDVTVRVFDISAYNLKYTVCDKDDNTISYVRFSDIYDYIVKDVYVDRFDKVNVVVEVVYDED